MPGCRRSVVWTVLLALGVSSSGQAQQVTIAIPQESWNEGYYEFIGGRWVFFGPSFRLGFNAGMPPDFGDFDPSGGLSTGFALGAGARGGRLNLLAGTGRSTVYTSTVPMLTVTQGAPGFLHAGRLVPFVTSVQPAVAFGPLVNPAAAGGALPAGAPVRRPAAFDDLRELDPPALQAAPPQAAPDNGRIAAGQAATAEAERLWLKGQRLEQEGKTGAARLLYQMALRQAGPALKARLQERIAALK